MGFSEDGGHALGEDDVFAHPLVGLEDDGDLGALEGELDEMGQPGNEVVVVGGVPGAEDREDVVEDGLS